MARRSNFIEGNDNFREQNLRFVRNEFEDNINQFFGGANPGGGTSQQKPPPRDSLIVQPTPEGAPLDPSDPGRNFELDVRRQFIRELGASRMTAHALAVRTFKVKDFNLRHFQRQRFRLSVELGDSRQNVVDAEVLRAIGEAVEKKEPDFESPPRTPSPPRNIDWHNVNRDSVPVRNDDRSRPRNREASGNFRGFGDNSREFVEHLGPERDQEPFNRNAGPKNVPNNRYNQNPSSDNRNAQHEFNRNNRNANPQEINRNNRNANQQEINRNNRNANQQEINRYNRNENPQEINRNNRNANPQELNRFNRNSDEFNRNNRNTNPQQEFHRSANPQMEFNQNIRNINPEIIRNNRIVNPQMPNRNPNTQESYRNNRNDEFNRNVIWQEINRNDRHASPQDYNRNPQEFNRNINPQESNRNMNPQGNRNLPLNPREVRGTQSNRRVMPPNFNNPGANPMANPNFRSLPPNPQERPQNLNNLRFNNNRQPPHHGPGNNDFMPDQQEDIDGTPIIDQLNDIDDNFLEFRGRQQPSPNSDFRQRNPNLAEQGLPPQIRHNYQRIVNNDKITICRQDWIEANRMELDNRNRPNNPNQRYRQFEDQGEGGYNDGPIMEDDDRFRRQQQKDNPRGPRFRNHSNNYDRNFASNQGNIIVHRNNDPNYLGRGHNDRNERRHFNADDHENDRAQSNDSVTFRGSNRVDVSPQRHQRGSGPGDRYQGDHLPQPANPNQNRSNKGRNAPNPRQSQDQTMARNSNSSGRNPGPTSKASQDRNPGRNTSTGGSRTNQDRNPRSTSGGETHGKDRSAPRSVKPGDASLKKPQQAGQENLPSVSHKNRAPTQTKPPNRSASEAKNDNSGAAKTSTFNRAQANASWENARAGQKRKAEEAKESESSRSSKVDNKRNKITVTPPHFIIAGISLPYINSNEKKLPQSEDESYAVTFFEQAPLYNTNIYAIDDGQIDDADEVMSDTESIDSNQSGSKGNKLNSKQIIRNKLRREWMVIYRENNYKDWYTWWKDYKWCGTEINKELDKHGDRKMRHRFMPKYPSTEILVREIFRSGRNGLKKNLFSHYRNMRSIFLLMNETFIGALNEEQNEKLQDLIRYIPNHLWLYKIRSMVYLWERYHRILKTLDESKVHKENELSAIALEWKDPLFHWLAKQAFDELKAISGVAWPEHKRLYHGL